MLYKRLHQATRQCWWNLWNMYSDIHESVNKISKNLSRKQVCTWMIFDLWILQRHYALDEIQNRLTKTADSPIWLAKRETDELLVNRIKDIVENGAISSAQKDQEVTVLVSNAPSAKKILPNPGACRRSSFELTKSNIFPPNFEVSPSKVKARQISHICRRKNR